MTILLDNETWLVRLLDDGRLNIYYKRCPNLSENPGIFVEPGFELGMVVTSEVSRLIPWATTIGQLHQPAFRVDSRV